MKTLNNLDILKLAYWKLIDIKEEENKKILNLNKVRKLKNINLQLEELEEEIIKVSKIEIPNY